VIENHEPSFKAVHLQELRIAIITPEDLKSFLDICKWAAAI
jgi:hypothetical protein